MSNFNSSRSFIVKDLKAILATLPDDMTVLISGDSGGEPIPVIACEIDLKELTLEIIGDNCNI